MLSARCFPTGCDGKTNASRHARDFASVKTAGRVLLLAMSVALGGCSLFGETGAPALSGPPVPALVSDASNRAEVAPANGYGAAEADAPPVDPSDDLAIGKRHFGAMNYGLAEQHFRRAIEKSTGSKTRDAEAWVGLAAAYDRLRRFELADRAYRQAIRVWGATPEILNNQGYSYLLRGDHRNARIALLKAANKDPGNAYIRNNLALLEQSAARTTVAR